jgi:hypothetical protein
LDVAEDKQEVRRESSDVTHWCDLLAFRCEFITDHMSVEARPVFLVYGVRVLSIRVAGQPVAGPI